jgi:hypothetical protein
VRPAGAPAFADRYGDAAPDPDAAPAPAADTGVLSDIDKAIPSGLAQGITGTIGLPGTIGGWARKGASKLGVPDPVLDATAKALRYTPAGVFTGPDAGDVQHALESAIGKPLYEPHTRPGKYVRSVFSALPSAAAPIGGLGAGARILNSVTGGVGSETGGQLAEGTPYEGVARVLGGFAAGIPTAKALSMAAPQTAERARNLAILDQAGIPVSAGTRTGSRWLQTGESEAANMPFIGGVAQRLQDRTANAYDRAITDRIFPRAELTARGIPAKANLPSPDVAAAGQAALKARYNQITGNHSVPLTAQLNNELGAVRANYARSSALTSRSSGLANINDQLEQIRDGFLANNMSIPGKVYQATRSQLGKLENSARNSEPQLAEAYRGLQKALDDAMKRSLPPDVARRLADTNLRYALMKQTENAIARAGEHLSPKGVAQAVRASRPGLYNRQAGALDDVVRAAADVIPSLPNSMTAARSNWQGGFGLGQIGSALSHLGTSAVAGSVFGWPGALAGLALPSAVAGSVVSPWGQRLLGSSPVPQRIMGGAVPQIAMQQGATLPARNDRNTAARAQYNRDRAEAARRGY